MMDVILLLLFFNTPPPFLVSGVFLCCTVNAKVNAQLRTQPFKCPKNLPSESIASAVPKGSAKECWEDRCLNFLSAIKGFGYLSPD